MNKTAKEVVMMNKLEKVAKLFDVELGEEFEVVVDDSRYNVKFDEDGFKVQSSIFGNWERYGDVLHRMLINECEIIKKPWKPKCGEDYWHWETSIGLSGVSKFNDDCDYARWKCGNCFKTMKEAETKGKEIMEQIRKEFEDA